MKTLPALGLAMTAFVLAGCNQTYQRSTTAGKPVIASVQGMYTSGSCEGWEPPEVSVSEAPKHGRVTHTLVKAPLQLDGSLCNGRIIDFRVSTYTPNPGFRGQDKLTIKYDMILTDGGTRGTQSRDITIDVK